MKTTFYYFLPLIILAIGCQNCSPRSTEEIKKFKISLRLIDGARYYSDIHSLIKTTFEANGQPVETSNKANIGLSYTVSQDSIGNANIKIIYDKVIVALNNNGDEQIFDAAQGKTSFDPVERILGNLIGASLNVVMNSKGEVVRVEGIDQLSENIMTSLNSSDEATEKAVKQQMSKLAGKAFFKDLLQQGPGLFPDTAIALGDSWSISSIQTAEIDFNANSRYLLDNIKNNIATIEMESVIESLRGNSSNPLDNPLSSSSLKGTQEGYLKVDTATGMINDSRITSSLSGVVTVMNTEVPITLYSEKQISSKAL